jgi:hypothetical protein
VQWCVCVYCVWVRKGKEQPCLSLTSTHTACRAVTHPCSNPLHRPSLVWPSCSLAGAALTSPQHTHTSTHTSRQNHTNNPPTSISYMTAPRLHQSTYLH